MQSRKSEINELLQGSIVKKKNPLAKPARVTLIISLVCTTLPSPALNTFFSFLAVTCFIYLLSRELPALKTFAVIAALAASLISGCAGYFVEQDPPEMAALFGPSAEYRSGSVKGWGILGLGLGNITPQSAYDAGNLEKALAVVQVRSYGLVSYADVRVYGK